MTAGAEPAARPVGAHRWVLPAVALAVALAVLAPVLGRGFVLAYDMVFAPRHTLLPDSLGLGSMLPRSVPSDAVVAFATWLVPGDIVQKLALAAALFFAALGAGRLVPTESVGTRVVAALAYAWSAYVAERLFIGHWQLLLAYACLPWIFRFGLDLRQGVPKAGARLVLASVPAVLTAPGGILAALTAMAAAGRRRLPFVAGVMLVLNAPWLLPGLLHPGASAASPDGVAAFAARAENWGTAVVTLLGLGGVWNSEVTPVSRSNPVLPLLTLAMVAAALLGLRVLAHRWGVAPARALVLLGAFGVLLAALPTFPAGTALMRWLTEHGPGFAVLRDSQRWIAWWALPLALGFALAAEAAGRWLTTTAGPRLVLVVAALFPIALLPDLAFAGFGRLTTVHYPPDWTRVREIIAADPGPGDVLTLPLGSFRQFDWNAWRTQLDPAPRVLTRPTVLDDTLFVGGRPVPGEDRRIPELRAALPDAAALTRAGITWLLLEKGTAGWRAAPIPPGAVTVFDGRWLTLYRLPGQAHPYNPPGPPAALILSGDLAAIILIASSLLWWGLPTGKLSPAQRTRTRE
ncbi:MAG TPA: hypothetical protein VFV67_32565 [Actinophytocola sp.]|uniref:hypothetical protein n=1 Tax=Actinophytocola sp. TaxID=1872138 RepID=UPI002DBFE4F7|nr:hypothetical protein [Actinophytocola sp.]HEU5475402.1 hypothetical protein [Actinophytocola sp.]